MRKRSGFTMIEILVVLGIILILAGMLFFGGRAIFGKGRETATRTTLGNLANMLAELDAKTRGATQFTGTFSAPGDVSIPGAARDLAVGNAHVMMPILRAMPLNKTAIEQLPADQIMKDDPATALNEALQPVVLDAWNNPIIVVPAGGLTGVNRGTVVNDTVVSRDARPFFASAGEDGNFQKGDDNLYSFEN